MPDLVIGTYELEPGFQMVVQKGITLTVGSEPVVDFSLPVGQAQQTLTVEGQVSQVDTPSTSVGSLMETKQITDLPLNGRNLTQLLTLQPGVTQIPLGARLAPVAHCSATERSIRLLGLVPRQAYLLDDQDMTSFWNNGLGSAGLGTALGMSKPSPNLRR